MSLQPETIPAIPEETARIARAIFPKGNRYLLLRDYFLNSIPMMVRMQKLHGA